MILLSIHLFLRFDECCNIKDEDFCMDLFTLREKGMKYLAVKIKGKADKTNKYLSIITNVEFSNFHIIFMLMIHMGK